MLNRTVIQVVTAGVDRPAITAAIAGGLVGLAGIGSTIWVAVKGIRAEDKRARRTEKRDIYARHLAACTAMMRASMFLTSHEEAGTTGPPKWDAVTAYADAASAAISTSAVVQLVAPPDVGTLATQFIEVVPGADPRRKSEPGDFIDVYKQLVRAMRADLGEPMPEEVQPPVPPVSPAPESLVT